MKKTYILVILIISLITLALYTTYAMFTADLNIGEFVELTASSIPTEGYTQEYKTITIESNDSKYIDLNIKNSTSNSLYYGVWYEMIDPSAANTDITIGVNSDSLNPVIGELSTNTTKKVSLCLINNSTEAIIINIGVGYSKTSNLNLPTNRTIITDTYDNTDYIVNFDANGGSIDINSKTVKYKQKYGSLPEATREGYEFVGWSETGNYIPDEYQEIEYLSSDGDAYIRTDDSPSMYDGNYSVELEELHDENTLHTYLFGTTAGTHTDNSRSNLQLDTGGTMAFYVNDLNGNVYTGARSEVTPLNQKNYVKVDVSSDNKTISLNVNNNIITEENIEFISKSTTKFSLFKSTAVNATFLGNMYYVKIYGNGVLVSNYIPCYNKNTNELGLYDIVRGVFKTNAGTGSFTKGNNINYINPSTIVNKNQNHTLKAVWKDITSPTLNLDKETFVALPFNDTWTYSDATVTDGVLSYDGTSTNKTYATSPFIQVNGAPYYFSMDAYLTTPLDSGNGGVMWTTYYYDENYNATTNKNGSSTNGHAIGFATNEWVTYEKTNEGDRWGPNAKYIKLQFKTSATYSKPPIKIRNLKVHGQMDNSFYYINIESSDNEGITTTKYAKGNQTKDYFNTNGTEVENNQITVTENGIYTIYVEDALGNSTIDTIEITNIRSK